MFSPLAPLNPLSHGHGCATIHLPLIACFFSPGLAWGKASGSPLPLLRYKGGGLSRPSTESRRREDCSVAAVSRRRRWPTRRRCVVSRWKRKGRGGAVKESCSDTIPSAAPRFPGGCRCCLSQVKAGSRIRRQWHCRIKQFPTAACVSAWLICARLVISSPALRGGLAGRCGLLR